MRTKLILFLPLLWILIGCSDSDSATLNISNSTFNDISASGVSVCVLMNRPTPKEISQFEGGKGVKVKLLSLRGIIFFIIKVGDNGWMDAPYNVHLSKNLKKLQKVVDGEGYAMHIKLIDTFTGKLVKQKIYGMPYDTSKQLYKMVMEQRKKFLSKEKYEENIRDIYGTFCCY